jgi:protein-tyrosine phosphatase
MISNVNSYINDTFGSKRGFLKSAKYSLLQRVGYLRELRDVDFSRVRKLVLICSGNVCRSPFGELYARHLGIDAESYGFDCRGGDPADDRVLALAAKHGIRDHGHVTRNIRDYQPSSEDLVIVMEPLHLEQLSAHINATAQVTLAPLWTKEGSMYLHDPFSGSSVYFENCAATIREALDTIAERMHEKRNNG